MSEPLTPFHLPAVPNARNMIPVSPGLREQQAAALPYTHVFDGTLISTGRSRQVPGCRVYWGSHGCDLERGHPGGPDSHDCGCCECVSHPDPDPGNPDSEPSCVARAPFYGDDTRFYGEDAKALGLPLVSGGPSPA